MALAPRSRARLHTTLALFGTSALWWRSGSPIALALSVVASVLALLAWFTPDRFAPLQRRLDRGIDALVKSFSWVVLGAVYFGVFTPLRCFRTLTGGDRLALRRKPDAQSYLTPVQAGSQGRFDRQF